MCLLVRFDCPFHAGTLHDMLPPAATEMLGKRGRKPTDKKLAYDADYVEEPRPVRKVRP